ncbi:MAG: HAD-IC family P-type ATPase, partial [Alphaproteobacteria bacterium]
PEGVIELEGESVDGREYANLEELARAGALCNDASLRRHDGQWTVEGDPMEGALLALARKVRLDDGTSLSGWTRTDSIPFDSQHRFMAVLDHDHEGNAFILVKGAPERILEMSVEQRAPSGGTEPLDEDYWRGRAENIAAEGQRVLAFAVRPVEPEHTVLEFEDVEAGLVLIGLAGIIDPPRAEAIEAVAECHRAGIRVKMITGDHAGTAVAIARQIGLQHPDQVLTGADLEGMDDQQLASSVLDADVFARTSPEHKLRLVKALQSHGLTVAMTGDGVNDAPALKRADAGIAMGITGSEAAKEASELVLADDNFASIAAAVREGRTVYDNIKKVLTWTLPTNGGEASTVLVALLFGMALPVTPLQILWINLVTAVTLGIALAFEPTEEGSMRRPPRPREEPLLMGELVWHIVLVSVLFLGGVFGIYMFARHNEGYSIELARTIAMNTLVVMEIFHLFFVRNIYSTSLTWKAVRGTPVVWATVVMVVMAQFAITYLPFMQEIFDTRNVSLRDGLIIVSIGAALFAIIETEKQVRLGLRRMRRARQVR